MVESTSIGIPRIISELSKVLQSTSNPILQDAIVIESDTGILTLGNGQLYKDIPSSRKYVPLSYLESFLNSNTRYDIDIPSDTWIITHNKGTISFSIQIYTYDDDENAILTLASPTPVDLDTFEIKFNSQLTGYVIVQFVV
jgi:hypothetical protein